MSRPRRSSSSLAVLTAAVSVVTLVVNATAASAAGSVLFDQPFRNNVANGVGPVAVPGVPAGSATNAACLSAAGNTGTGPLLSCPSATDTPGNGRLRLTPASTQRQGGVFGAVSVPTSQGLHVSFTSYQYGGSSPGADGLAFVLAAVDPANPLAPSVIGQPGGSLGYSAAFTGRSVGLSNGYLGVGLDVYGNFSNSVYQGTGCTNPAYISTTGGRVPGQVIIRGPGRNGAGYCAVNSTASSTSAPAIALRAATRSAAAVPVDVVVNTTRSPFTTDNGIAVPAGQYTVRFTPVGGTTRTLTGALPVVASSLYPSPTWLNADGYPRQLAFGWVGSTGSVTDSHEVDSTRVVSFNAVPDLRVVQTSSVGAAPQAGDPVTYTISSGVDPGVTETAPVSVTQTLPQGVLPRGAFGSGWVCEVPAGQTVRCTNSNGPFSAGSSLPAITVAATVTGSGVTPELVQSATVVTASSIDANPGYAGGTTAVTPLTAPTGLTVAPAVGPVGGGTAVTVSGTNFGGATAITIGTAAEQAAGTSVVLLPCAGDVSAVCFTTNGDGTLGIPSMPPRPAAAPVTVSVVTRGAAGAANFVYASAPDAPAAPTASAGVAAATVSWSPPVSNGSAITGYVVTPVRNGVPQPSLTFDASTTSRTLTGLLVGASYSFRVAATNAYGTGPVSPASNAVVPYTTPAAPTITSVAAGTNSAVLTWTAPADGGSAVTGYRITPYVDSVARTAVLVPATPTTRSVTGLTSTETYTFRIAAINAAGTGPDSAPAGPVRPNPLPSLIFGPPPAGEVGAAYRFLLAVSGGTVPLAWSVSAGTLPPGLTLDPATGVLSGSPREAGSWPFTVRVTDASGFSDDRPATITVAAAPRLSFAPPPTAKAYDPYSYPLTVVGGTGPFGWSVSAGALPPGLTLDPGSGLLSGTPTSAGSFTFTVEVTDSFGQRDSRPVDLVVDPLAGLTISAPASASLGTVAAGTPAVTGRLGPVTVSDDRGPRSGAWTATVAITPFRAGSGSTAETIAPAAVAYVSGPAVSTTGNGSFTPQLGAPLDVPRTAAAWTGAAGANSATWNPALSVSLPTDLVVGAYRATVTHSVI
ncbi:putative Ig domain-containing protein [Micromonospora sp. NPDC051300]|uniref:putative Ig domain-containing protein n=1 Tax=Micromonospora sp. NPDC051300 TaxID=3364286 RepID=UPI0037B5743C